MTKKKKKSRSGKITTPLAGHKRVGKALVPPMLQLEGVSFSSWVNDRLPEMLWASLVITVIPRDQALEAFRDIAACSGLLIPDTDLGENPRRERGV
ncbi:hypothetical protein MNU13_27105 [Pseudomonas aeruginosa]|uniref:hypothetical protein n=1 Tax=Pseudomonas aeruginosa TaxID=287 RepID=UPI0021A862C3|nr:hypothetical protein [Pseudomonas aeruginosa]MCT2504943.1 hypothetical protein [Pseudomonas aeruginosa]